MSDHPVPCYDDQQAIVGLTSVQTRMLRALARMRGWRTAAAVGRKVEPPLGAETSEREMTALVQAGLARHERDAEPRPTRYRLSPSGSVLAG